MPGMGVKRIMNILKKRGYNTFRIEETKKFKNDIYKKENFIYDPEKNEYTCPNGKKLKYISRDNGYQKKLDIYECEDCSGCDKKSLCTKGVNNRRIKISRRLEELKKEAKEKLKSEKGIEFRKKRGIDVEPVFGHIK